SCSLPWTRARLLQPDSRIRIHGLVTPPLAVLALQSSESGLLARVTDCRRDGAKMNIVTPQREMEATASLASNPLPWTAATCSRPASGGYRRLTRHETRPRAPAERGG